MTQLSWKIRGTVVAACCVLSIAALFAWTTSEGQAQSPAGNAAQRSDAAAQPAGTEQPAGAAAQAGRMPSPVVDVHDLMNLFNKPVYMYLKSAMAQQPADEEGWKTIQDRGLQTAEVANLVALRPVDQSQEQWLRAAANLQSAGITLAEAAKAQDWQRTVQAYQGVVQSCNACHQARAPEEAPKLKP